MKDWPNNAKLEYWNIIRDESALGTRMIDNTLQPMTSYRSRDKWTSREHAAKNQFT